MKIKCYSYRDTRSGVFTPFLFVNLNEVEMCEQVARLVSIGKLSPDLVESDLYFMGIFDDNTGCIEEYLPKNLLNIKSLLPKEE